MERLTLAKNHLVADDRKTIYWHHELPPFGAEAVGEHIVEAASRRVPSTLASSR